MGSKTGTKKSNIIIAVGYCLAAIFILFNYHGKGISKSKKKPVKGNYINKLDQKTNQNLQYLKKQLEEEKRVNREMREFFKNYQSNSSAKVSDGSFISNADVNNIQQKLPELTFEPVEMSSRKNPFNGGRNPFRPTAHYSGNASLNENTEFDFFLRPRPLVPFLISGTGYRTKVTGNFD